MPFVVHFGSLLLGGQADRAIPPGVRKADKLPNPADDPPLLAPQPRAVDPARLKREADDLPSLVAPEKAKYPGLEIEVGQSLEDHPLMASIILGRVRELIGES